MNNIENIISIQTESFYYMLPFLTDLYGLRCEIFYPLLNQSIYQNSSKFSYNQNPNEIKQLLITNQYELLQQGQNIYDPFNPSQVECIVQIKDKLKDNCKVKVYKGSSFVEYRSDINTVMMMGTNQNPLFIRHKLIPII